MAILYSDVREYARANALVKKTVDILYKMSIVFFYFSCNIDTYPYIHIHDERGTTMNLPVVAAKQYEGTTKDGRGYNFTTLWVPLDDGTLFEVRSDVPYKQGDVLDFALESRFSRLQLVPKGFARQPEQKA